MDLFSVTLPLAYALDLALGDPRWLPHPVKGLGKLIQRAEAVLRAQVHSEVVGGWFLVIGITVGTLGFVQGSLLVVRALSPWCAWGLEVFLLYACLSTRDLAVESWPVFRALQAGDLKQARAQVAMIVGRDTDSLTEPEIVRATVETIGESAMDGIIAPLFYAAIGGAPLACLYKAVNTMDSMVGYRSARYLKFGQAAAWLDSWMNVIPASLTAFLIAAAAQGTGFSGRESLRVLFRDAWHRRENSWIPEAALAGALGVRLGGTNFYQGKPAVAPSLGDPHRPLTADRIPQAIRIMYACSFLGIVAAVVARL